MAPVRFGSGRESGEIQVPAAHGVQGGWVRGASVHTNDPLVWSMEESEAWLAKDASSRLEDIRQLQEASFSARPGIFNRRAWTEAAQRFTRLVLLELRANARACASLCLAAYEAGRVDSETRELVEKNGGPDWLEGIMAVAFDRIETEFERRDWTGSGVTSPEQATRLLFVGERVEQVVSRDVQESGLTKHFLPGLKGFVDSQLRIAFTTPAGQPLPSA